MRHAELRQYLPLAALLTLMLLLQLLVEFVPGAQSLLRLETSMGWSEPWRWLSGNLIHANWEHLAVNAGSVVAAVLLFPELLPARRLLPITLLSVLGVSCGLLWLDQDINWYVGFSGALYGLLALGGLYWLNTNSVAKLVLLFVVVKLGWEQWQGAVSFGEALFAGGGADGAAGKVATQAHLYGAITGVAMALGLFLRKHTAANRG